MHRIGQDLILPAANGDLLVTHSNPARIKTGDCQPNVTVRECGIAGLFKLTIIHKQRNLITVEFNPNPIIFGVNRFVLRPIDQGYPLIVLQQLKCVIPIIRHTEQIKVILVLIIEDDTRSADRPPRTVE